MEVRRLNRSLNAKRNIIVGILYKFVTIIFPFMLRTVMIKELGMNYLGLNSLFSSVLQIMSLTELGLSNAIVFSMYKPIAENNQKEICKLLNYYKKFYKVIGCVIVFLGCLLMPFIEYFIKGDVPEGVNIYVIFGVYIINMAISYLLCAYKNALLNAYQRVDVQNLVLIITKCVLYTLQITILVLWKDYYLYLIVMPLCTIVENLFTAIIVNKMYPHIRCEGVISIEEKKIIHKKLSGLVITKLCHASRNSFDSVFVSAFIGLSATAIYNNYFYLMNSINGLMSIVSTSLLAGVGNSITTESVEKNYEDMQKINCIYMWVAGWTSICLLCLYQPFMELWAGKSSLLNNNIMVLFVLYYYESKMGDIRALYSDAAGLWWENRIRMIGEAVTNLILNIVLGWHFGMKGILWATIISMFIYGFIMSANVLFRVYYKGKSTMVYYHEHLIYAICTVANAVICSYICSVIKISWIGFFIKIVICIIWPNIFYFIIYRNSLVHNKSYVWLLSKLR